MNDLIETIRYNNGREYVINIHNDDSPESPREWDNLGKCSFNHRRYDFGDKDAEKFETIKEFEDFIKKNNGIYKYVYMYEHSGITINTTGFNCQWDSGLLGFIYALPEDIRKFYEVKRITKAIKEKAYARLESEIKLLDIYIRGDVVGFKVFNDAGEEIDSCWNYYDKADAIAEARSMADHDFKANDLQLELPFAA